MRLPLYLIGLSILALSCVVTSSDTSSLFLDDVECTPIDAGPPDLNSDIPAQTICGDAGFEDGGYCCN